MNSQSSAYEILTTQSGRVVVPSVPPSSGYVFWTTRDFHGSLDPGSTQTLLSTISEIGGSASRIETCRQVHGVDSVEVTSTDEGWSECSDCDALWTRRRSIALGIKIADCLPLTIIEPDRGTVINLHAGWRGAAAGIVARTLHEARLDGANHDANAQAWIGPSIRSCCFEVGEEVVEAFRETHPEVDDHVDRSRSKPHLDLAGLVRGSLIRAGMRAEQIWDGGLCTRCPDSMFHSYRRSGKNSGRNLAVAGL